jgi:hypothetical protein
VWRFYHNPSSVSPVGSGYRVLPRKTYASTRTASETK